MKKCSCKCVRVLTALFALLVLFGCMPNEAMAASLYREVDVGQKFSCTRLDGWKVYDTVFQTTWTIEDKSIVDFYYGSYAIVEGESCTLKGVSKGTTSVYCHVTSGFYISSYAGWFTVDSDYEIEVAVGVGGSVTATPRPTSTPRPTATPAPTPRPTSGTCGALSWNLKNGTLTIRGNGPMPDYDTDGAVWDKDLVQRLVVGEGVTSIGSYAFYYSGSLEAVDLPDSLQSIDRYAFYNCDALAEIDLPVSLESIGDSAFSGCISLAEIGSLDSLQSIGDSAFSGCNNLAEIGSLGSLQSIGNYAFSNCNVLKGIDLQDCLGTIGDYAFAGCRSLTKIVFPNSLQSIGEYAFRGCVGLKEVKLPSSLKLFGSCAFRECSGLEYVEFMPGVDLSSDDADCEYLFYGCTGLKKVKIGAGVKISDPFSQSFDGCTSLSELEIGSGASIYIGYRAFADTALKEFTVENGGQISIRLKAFEGAPLESIVLNNCESIWLENQAFMSNKTLREVLFTGSGSASIGREAFRECTKLEKLTLAIEEGIKFDGSAFSKCTALSCVEMPLEYMPMEGGTYLFSGCTALESIELPRGMTELFSGMFGGCTALQSFVIPDGVETIGSHAFNGCSSLKTVRIPEGVTEIDYSAFYECRTLGNLRLPLSLETLGGRAFYDCRSLNAAFIPNVHSYEDSVFMNCTGLKVLYIDKQTFTQANTGFNNMLAGCTGLRHIYYGGSELSSTTNIDRIYSSFYGNVTEHLNTDFTFTYLPDAIREIEEAAFEGSSLRCVVCPEGLTTIGASAFKNSEKLIYVQIPSSVTYIAEDAFSGCSSGLLVAADYGSYAYDYAVQKGYNVL